MDASFLARPFACGAFPLQEPFGDIPTRTNRHVPAHNRREVDPCWACHRDCRFSCGSLKKEINDIFRTEIGKIYIQHFVLISVIDACLVCHRDCRSSCGSLWKQRSCFCLVNKQKYRYKDDSLCYFRV